MGHSFIKKFFYKVTNKSKAGVTVEANGLQTCLFNNYVVRAFTGVDSQFVDV